MFYAALSAGTVVDHASVCTKPSSTKAFESFLSVEKRREEMEMHTASLLLFFN